MKSKLTIILILGAVLFIGWRLLAGGGPATNWPVVNENPTGTSIVVLGDSIAAGHGLSANQAFPALLAAELGRPVINAGVSGNTTADGLRRLQQDVLSENPGVVIILLGGNDLLRRQPTEAQFGNLRQMIQQSQQAGALVVLVGIDGDGFIFASGYNDQYRDLARETGAVFVPDILDGIRGRHMQNDRIHPTAEGQRRIAAKIMQHAGEYLGR